MLGITGFSVLHRFLHVKICCANLLILLTCSVIIYNGIVEVNGSIPFGSTNEIKGFRGNSEALLISVSAQCQHETESRGQFGP